MTLAPPGMSDNRSSRRLAVTMMSPSSCAPAAATPACGERGFPGHPPPPSWSGGQYGSGPKHRNRRKQDRPRLHSSPPFGSPGFRLLIIDNFNVRWGVKIVNNFTDGA
jgi:hypothetical protein